MLIEKLTATPAFLRKFSGGGLSKNGLLCAGNDSSIFLLLIVVWVMVETRDCGSGVLRRGLRCVCVCVCVCAHACVCLQMYRQCTRPRGERSVKVTGGHVHEDENHFGICGLIHFGISGLKITPVWNPCCLSVSWVFPFLKIP